MLHLTFYILRFIENLMNPPPSYVLLHWGYWDWEVKNRDFKWFAKLYHFSSTNLNQLNRYFKVTRDTMYYFCVHLQLLKVKLWTDTKKKAMDEIFFTQDIVINVLFMSYSTLDEVSKLVPNLEYLFSFNFQLKNAATKFCFLGHLHAVKVP